ncbi:hypothetical protein [Anaerococcus nagyae]
MIRLLKWIVEFTLVFIGGYLSFVVVIGLIRSIKEIIDDKY